MRQLADAWYDWQERPWKPVSILGLIGCVLAFVVLALPAGTTPLGRFNVMHYLVLIPHEGGHMVAGGLVNVVSSILGAQPEFDPLATRGWSAFLAFCTVAAGTAGQLLVILIPAAVFFWSKSTTPLVFFLFCLFASLPGIGIYMMDARVLTLDYVSPGGADYEGIQKFGQDWTFIFRYLGIPMGVGETLGRVTYLLGWLGMLGSALALGWLYYREATADG